METTATKILVIFTGGTIGSRVQGHIIQPEASQTFQLLALYQQHFNTHAQQVEFETLSPITLLSENLTLSVWTQLCNALDAVDKQGLTGIIVTHGTDTLAYTACALSYYGAQLDLPILLVASDYPLTDPRANGLANFHAAVCFITQQQARSGVFVAYRNANQPLLVHWGTRLASCLPLSNEFMSVANRAYLQFNRDNFNTLQIPAQPLTEQRWSLTPSFSTQVLLIRPYPGLDYANFNLNKTVAILHDCYHSGTACIAESPEQNTNLLAFIERCKAHNIQVYLAPALASEHLYATTEALLIQGAIMLWNMALEAAYVKLLLAYGNFTDPDLRLAFIQQNIAHEIL